MEIGSDGRSLVQFRYGERRRSPGARPLDARVTEAEAQAALAVLRAEPAATPFAGGRGERVDIAPLYLAQARERGGALLGQTRMLGRPAYLLAYRTDQLPGHLERALNNGVTKEEIGEIITHLAFYAGWPAAMTAGTIARKIFDARKP